MLLYWCVQGLALAVGLRRGAPPQDFFERTCVLLFMGLAAAALQIIFCRRLPGRHAGELSAAGVLIRAREEMTARITADAAVRLAVGDGRLASEPDARALTGLLIDDGQCKYFVVGGRDGRCKVLRATVGEGPPNTESCRVAAMAPVRYSGDPFFYRDTLLWMAPMIYSLILLSRAVSTLEQVIYPWVAILAYLAAVAWHLRRGPARERLSEFARRATRASSPSISPADRPAPASE